MANSSAVQKIIDGPFNGCFKLIGTLDTSDQAYTIVVDPATLSSITTQGDTKATKLRVMYIDANIEDGLTVTLWWDVDGTQPNATRIEDLNGRLVMPYRHFGGLPNNAGTPNGKIALSTQGWSTGTLSYSIILETVKY
jgi:hypothetical protein